MTEKNWQTYLKSQGAIFNQNAVQHYGDPTHELNTASTNNSLCDLSHLGLLALNGEDATSFLQGQVTNDVNALNGQNAQLNGYCSPKGRLLALFLTFLHNGSLYLQFSEPLVAPIMKRLKMYVMRAKVNIDDVSDDLIRFGINGPNASEIMQKIFSTLPKEDFDLSAITLDGQSAGAIVKLPSIEGQQRFEIIIDEKHAQQTWETLKNECQLVGKSCWDWFDIQTGLPNVVEKTQEQFVPQMLNLDILNGINFKKGCYTGQEIVARTHYLGTVKRRTFKVSIASSEQPNVGDKILDKNHRDIGQIVTVASNLTNGFDALIEIRIEEKESGTLFWQNYPITFGELPYSLQTSAPS